MNLPGAYTLDIQTLKLNSYRLLCLFYASKEISRLSDPQETDTSSAKLQRLYFSREMTHLLLAIAIGIRILDDQMMALPEGSPTRREYLMRRDDVNRRRKCMMLDDMSLRDVCNKVLHANVVEPHSTDGTEQHAIDGYNWMSWSYAHEESPDEAGPQPEPIKWSHLSGHVRLGGSHGREQWWHLLEVPEFVGAVFELLAES